MTRCRPKPENAADLLALSLLEKGESKYVVFRVAKCLVDNRVRIGDRDGIRAALRESNVTFGLRAFGEVLALRNMMDEVEEYEMKAKDGGNGKRFGPLSPRFEPWIIDIPTKAERRRAKINEQ
jgi:hypothetical protein